MEPLYVATTEEARRDLAATFRMAARYGFWRIGGWGLVMSSVQSPT